MLDVHVLVMDYTPQAAVDRCLNSLVVAVDAAPFPVHVYVLPGIEGHLGKARTAGYALGSSPYVTHVDDDDAVRPEAFSVLAEALEAGFDAITTGEFHLTDDGKITPAPESRHHLAVVKRSIVQRAGLDRFRFFPDQYLLSRVIAHHLPVCVYDHYIHRDSGSRQQRRAHPEEAARERAMINNPTLFTAEAMAPLDISAAIDAWMESDDAT